ncbi:2-hydroxyacid dehydrogenase [Caballeronia sp. LjRoot34]|uniref:2-hydroxyacid dehydrogenase n=1 Tax=Caballeronia sp. LjRoot34 TaxID=3342325 RepID=UPI003ECE5A1B
MKVTLFTTHPFEEEAFELAREDTGSAHALTYVSAPLDTRTAELARASEVVVPFVNDRLDAPLLRQLAAYGVKLIALRSAGHDNLDLVAARREGLRAVYVPSYTPHAVAEHVFALVLSLLRHVPRALARVHEGNFSLNGLIGSQLVGRTFGVIGLGRIGRVVAGIAEAFGCEVLACDPLAQEKKWPLLPLDELLARSHVVSLHAPLNAQTRHLIDARRLALMQDGAVLVNTSRGPILDTHALINALKEDRLGGAALDVYEREAEVFYVDHSDKALQDDDLARLLSFPNVIVTSHMGFMTREALGEIARTTLASVDEFEKGKPLSHELTL